MRVLVACEFSGIVREAFKAKGHDAWSCDLLPTEIPGQHIQGDVLEILDDGWDLLIGHPPCTYLANSGARWLFEKAGRWEQLDDAVCFFKNLLNSKIPKKAIENPQPHKWAIERIGRNYDQKVQPHFFGDRQKKGLCLWLEKLPPLMSTDILLPPQNKEELKAWESVWREAPGPDQAKNRSRTFRGFAQAMADQWG
jgi:hypothetical protein